jgi:hypothetical protein
MLHATYAGGKSNRYKVYMGYRDDQTPHVHEEDEITSTVLGPLDFLPASAVHQFWQTVFQVIGQSKLLPTLSPACSTVRFWDSRMASDRGLRIEPDGRVDFFWPAPTSVARRILLIEVKWRAPLSGSDQLHRQWLDYLEDDERSDALHVFLGIETTAGVAAKMSGRGNVWTDPAGNDRLILVSWLQVRAALAILRDQPDGLGRWARLADRFLEKVGIRRFLGFVDLLGAQRVSQSTSTPLFWSGFSPWHWVEQTARLKGRPQDNLFWRN